MDSLQAALIPVMGLSIGIMILLAVLGLLVLFGFSLLIAFVIWRIGKSFDTENWLLSSFWKIWFFVLLVLVTAGFFVVRPVLQK